MRWNELGVFVIIAGLLSGCCSYYEKHDSITAALWDDPSFTHSRAPDRNAPVEIYYDDRSDDYFAVYTELRDGAHGPKRRTYRLGEGLEAVEKRRKPRFTSINSGDMTTIPVNPGTNVVPRAEVNGMVTIYTAERVYGPFPLPHYQTSSGTMVKVALTPVAVTGDVAVVATIIAIVSAPYLLVGLANCH